MPVRSRPAAPAARAATQRAAVPSVTRAPPPPASSSTSQAPAPEAQRSGAPADRAPGSLAAAVLEARTLARSDAAEGKEPILTAHAAARVEQALAHAVPRVRAHLQALVLEAPSPTHRAVLLKAMAARATQLAHHPEPAAVGVLEEFARAIRPLARDALLVRTTSLDLDGTRSTSAFDPQVLWEKRGTIQDSGSERDTETHNDGLFQRFTSSCGPTTLQMALAEADPVFALALHKDGLTSDSTTDAVARFQRALLEAHGGVAIDRKAAHLRARYRNALGRMGSLENVRQKYGGFPTAAELARIHAEPWPERDEGLSMDAMHQMLTQHLTPLTGVRYRGVEFGRTGSVKHIDDVARALRSGVDVPFGISEPGHWMLLSAVDGKKPNRSFLVSDPDGGRTEWVPERVFVRGTFAREPFGISKAGERPFVDSFFLPVRA